MKLVQLATLFGLLFSCSASMQAQDKKPNILAACPDTHVALDVVEQLMY